MSFLSAIAASPAMKATHPIRKADMAPNTSTCKTAFMSIGLPGESVCDQPPLLSTNNSVPPLSIPVHTDHESMMFAVRTTMKNIFRGLRLISQTKSAPLCQHFIFLYRKKPKGTKAAARGNSRHSTGNGIPGSDLYKNIFIS